MRCKVVNDKETILGGEAQGLIAVGGRAPASRAVPGIETRAKIPLPNSRQLRLAGAGYSGGGNAEIAAAEHRAVYCGEQRDRDFVGGDIEGPKARPDRFFQCIPRWWLRQG